MEGYYLGKTFISSPIIRAKIINNYLKDTNNYILSISKNFNESKVKKIDSLVEKLIKDKIAGFEIPSLNTSFYSSVFWYDIEDKILNKIYSLGIDIERLKNED